MPNHITWVDAIILQLACPRPVRFIIDEEFLSQTGTSAGAANGGAPSRSIAVSRARQFDEPLSRLKPANSFAFSQGRPTLAHRHAGAATAWIRNDRASRPRHRWYGFSRSTLGFDLLISWRKILSEVAETFSLSRHRRLRRALFPRRRQRSHASTKICLSFGADCFEQRPDCGSMLRDALCADSSARLSPTLVTDRNGRQQVESRKTPRSFDRAQSLPSENIPGPTNRNCVTSQQRCSRC